MSSQKGNVGKTGAPKHKNHHAFKNSLHDTNKRTQAVRDLTVSGVCTRCKDIVDWKIKYKKYKPLTQPKKCVKCHEKAVKNAYYIVCEPCAKSNKICAKCTESVQIVIQPGLAASEEAKQQSELDYEIKQLPERKRRTLYRLKKGRKLNAEGKEVKSNDDEDEDGSSDLSSDDGDLSEEPTMGELAQEKCDVIMKEDRELANREKPQEELQNKDGDYSSKDAVREGACSTLTGFDSETENKFGGSTNNTELLQLDHKDAGTEATDIEYKLSGIELEVDHKDKQSETNTSLHSKCSDSDDPKDHVVNSANDSECKCEADNCVTIEKLL